MGTDTRRLLVATVASIAVVIFWQMLFAPKKGQPGAKAQAVAEQSTKGASTPAAGATAPAAAPLPVAADAPEERITLEGKDFAAVISSHGGVLASLTLKGDKFVEDKAGKTVPIDLVRSALDTSRALAIVPTPENGGSNMAKSKVSSPCSPSRVS